MICSSGSDLEDRKSKQLKLPGETKSAARRRRRRGSQVAVPQTDVPIISGKAQGYASGLTPARKKVAAFSKGIGSDWCSFVTKSLRACGEERSSALLSLRGSVHRHSFDVHGCWVVQEAFEVADTKQIQDLAFELRGHLVQAILSPFANFVVQKAIEKLPVTVVSELMEELRGRGAEVSAHRYGCRIMCGLFQNLQLPPQPAIVALVEDVLKKAGDLCKDEFGHFVMEAILEHGLPVHKNRIAQALCAGMDVFATHRQGSRVIEQAWHQCCSHDRSAIANEVLCHPGGIVALALDSYGCFVVKALLNFGGQQSLHARILLQQASDSLKANKYGFKVLGALGALDCAGAPGKT